jgi:hypothetical protein
MRIIKSTKGERLRLTPTRLTELDAFQMPYYTTKKDLQEALGVGWSGTNYVVVADLDFADLDFVEHRVPVVRIRDVRGYGISLNAVFDAEKCRIGCKTFDKKTFNLILKTMGLKKRPVPREVSNS